MVGTLRFRQRNGAAVLCVLALQAFPGDGPTVARQEESAAGPEEPPPVADHLHRIIRKGRENRTGEGAQEGVPHKGDLIIHDQAH